MIEVLVVIVRVKRDASSGCMRCDVVHAWHHSPPRQRQTRASRIEIQETQPLLNRIIKESYLRIHLSVAHDRWQQTRWMRMFKGIVYVLLSLDGSRGQTRSA